MTDPPKNWDGQSFFTQYFPVRAYILDQQAVQ